MKISKLFVIAASLFAGSIALASRDESVPQFKCLYSYVSEGQKIDAALSAKFHYEPYGLRTIEMTEAKSREAIMSFAISDVKTSGSLVIITANGNIEGVKIPVQLTLPVGGGKAEFVLAGSAETADCSAVK